MDEAEKKEVVELVTQFGELYTDLMFLPIKQIAEAKFNNDLTVCQQRTAGDMLIASIPSLANQIDHTLSPTDFAKELAKAVIEFDKERMRLANEAQAAIEGG